MGKSTRVRPWKPLIQLRSRKSSKRMIWDVASGFRVQTASFDQRMQFQKAKAYCIARNIKEKRVRK